MQNKTFLIKSWNTSIEWTTTVIFLSILYFNFQFKMWIKKRFIKFKVLCFYKLLDVFISCLILCWDYCSCVWHCPNIWILVCFLFLYLILSSVLIFDFYCSSFWYCSVYDFWFYYIFVCDTVQFLIIVYLFFDAI